MVYHTYNLLISKGLHGITARSLECVLMSSSISVALKGSQVSPKITCSYTYAYVACCYAAWDNNYSGQEEATLYIVKCLKEDRKLAFQMRNEVYIQQQCHRLKQNSRKAPGSIYRSHPSLVRKNHLLIK